MKGVTSYDEEATLADYLGDRECLSISTSVILSQQIEYVTRIDLCGFLQALQRTFFAVLLVLMQSTNQPRKEETVKSKAKEAGHMANLPEDQQQTQISLELRK
jgi:hypothetical protein